jgi:hypothetical protein
MSGKAFDTILVGIYLSILLGGATTIAGVATLMATLGGGLFVDWYKALDRDDPPKGSPDAARRRSTDPGSAQPPKLGR